MDLINFEKVVSYHNCVHNILSSEGIELFQNIEKKYSEILKNHKEITFFDYKNQPYNFTDSAFIKLNS